MHARWLRRLEAVCCLTRPRAVAVLLSDIDADVSVRTVAVPLAATALVHVLRWTVSAKQIQRLWTRFRKLDRSASGAISSGDFFKIPELAMNPLAHRISAALEMGNNSGEVNFRGFVHAMNVFHKNAPRETKLKCTWLRRWHGACFVRAIRCPRAMPPCSKPHATAAASASVGGVVESAPPVVFSVYDVDHDGFISVEDLTSVLSALVGTNLGEDEIARLARNTVKEYDSDGDDMLSIDEFRAVRGLCCVVATPCRVALRLSGRVVTRSVVLWCGWPCMVTHSVSTPARSARTTTGWATSCVAR